MNFKIASKVVPAIFLVLSTCNQPPDPLLPIDPDNVGQNNNSAIETPARRFSSVRLVALNSDGQSKSFFSSKDGQVSSSRDAINSPTQSENIDFGYFWGDVGLAQLASPNALRSIQGFELNLDKWTMVNHASFSITSLDHNDFLLIETWEAIDEAFQMSATLFASEVMRNLEQGQVIAFQTDPDKPGGSKKGLISVLTLNQGLWPDGFVEVAVVIQEVV